MKTANPPEKSVKRDANFSQFFFNFKKWSFLWFHFKVKSMAVWIVHLPLEIHFLLFMVRVKMADSGQRYANRWNGEGVVKMKTPFTEKPASRQDFLSRTHIGYTSASFVKCWRLSWSALMFRPGIPSTGTIPKIVSKPLKVGAVGQLVPSIREF